MNSSSRLSSTLKNLIVSLGSQIITLILLFISRTIFIRILGAEYLGINSLFTNILTVLSLAELGIGNVMIYSLYKPLVDKDESRIRALLNYYRKIYQYIALFIFIFGVGSIPLLKSIVNTNISHTEIILYYLLYLLNTVFTYLIMYKSTLINADQKIYILKVIATIVTFLKEIAQILVLLYSKDFLLYL